MMFVLLCENAEARLTFNFQEQLQICSSSYLRQEDADFMDCLGISQNEFIDAQIAEVICL